MNSKIATISGEALSNRYSNSTVAGSNKVVIDADEADLSVLEENLRLTSELTSQISQSLKDISNKNARTIKSIDPLMIKINKLKLQQRNFQSTLKLVENIKDYATTIKSLDKSLNSCGDLNSMKKIENYCSTVVKYQNLQRELEQKDMSDFEGLMKGLSDSIRDSDVTLKYEFIGKLKKLNKHMMNEVTGGSSRLSKEDEDLIRHMKLIQHFMKNKRGRSLVETVIKERKDFNLTALRSVNLSLPTIMKDQNFIYDGEKNTTMFMKYSTVLQDLMTAESAFLSKFLDDFQDIQAVLLETFKPSIDEFESQYSKFVSFVETHKFNYGTMYYELDYGIKLIIERLTKFDIQPPKKLVDMASTNESKCQGVFGDFFRFMEQRYAELMFGDHVGETLNNTFMSIVTRLNKFSNFYKFQLQAISKMPNGSWLPIQKPIGFQEVKINSTDSNYLLSIYYGDLIEFNYFCLENKYRNRLNEEDLGIMLMFNLDGLQNFIDNSTTLKQILGQSGFQRLEKLKKKTMERATSEWTKMTTRLMQASTKQGANFNLSNKELTKLIDEFNRIFDNNFQKIQSKNLPPFFKKQLVTDINKMLVPAYRVFYTSLMMDSGTKSIMKHFKYDVNGLQSKITSLG